METTTTATSSATTRKTNKKTTSKNGKVSSRSIRKEKLSKTLHRFAYAGIALNASLSAFLNGMANASHADQPILGWMIGVTIPAILLVLGKIAGTSWKMGYTRFSYGMAITGSFLLFLSVFHCASSLASLTGSHWLISLPMAIAIDVGFLGCEIASNIDE